ncbi:protease I [Natronobacillus azotifigens]|uniref:Type 1 glutamine amidotransferase n=1 Tax=Natronobacillus azotifigens TaxID=472978 RepID=A0A9J6R949_9BACI|nr:type 1 glutamine amidotransferase domain-containing protein [Natronobacillus azotifigens]MCZ0702194.1 type 1 glutamine amidotransferase [Natronobacillus azotifigens]
MKKVAVVISDLFEDVEYTGPAEAYEDAGHEVVTIGHEKEAVVTGKKGESKFPVDRGIGEVSVEEFDALLIPGGFAPDIMRDDDRFVAFAKAFMDEKKPVFAICHGPQLLITAKALEGRKATGYKSIRVDMEYAGVNFIDDEVVVCQEQLVTSRTPDDIDAFNRESLRLLSK